MNLHEGLPINSFAPFSLETTEFPSVSFRAQAERIKATFDETTRGKAGTLRGAWPWEGIDPLCWTVHKGGEGYGDGISFRGLGMKLMVEDLFYDNAELRKSNGDSDVSGDLGLGCDFVLDVMTTTEPGLKDRIELLHATLKEPQKSLSILEVGTSYYIPRDPMQAVIKITKVPATLATTRQPIGESGFWRKFRDPMRSGDYELLGGVLGALNRKADEIARLGTFEFHELPVRTGKTS